MIRFIFVFVMFIHGLLHLIGLSKSYHSGNGGILRLFKGLSVLWLFASLFFMIAILLFLLKDSSFVYVVMVAIVFSQVLIFLNWEEAKFGTIVNILILAAIFSDILVISI